MKMKYLTPSQIMVLVVSGVLGVDIIMVQHNIVSIAKQDAWISLALSGLLVFIAAIPIIYLMLAYPQKDAPQIILAVAGKWLGRVILIPLMVFFIIYAGLSARIFAQVIRVFLLESTPMVITVAFMVVVVIYLLSKGVYTIGAVLDILFPLYIIALMFLITISASQIDPSNIQPILFRNTSNVVKAIIPGFNNFTGYAMVAYFMCYTQEKKPAIKAYILGLGIPIFFYVALTIICIMVFGVESLRVTFYPTLGLAKSVEFQSGILDRLESFMATFCIAMVFGSMVIISYGSIRNITEFFSIPPKGEKYVIYAHLIILPIVAFAISKDWDVLEFYRKSKYIDTFVFLIFIPLMALRAGMRRRKGR
jgi:spore germination protein